MARQKKPAYPPPKRSEETLAKLSGRTMKLPSLHHATSGARACRRKDKPAWQDPTPKTGGLPPLQTSTGCSCSECRRIRPQRLSWPPVADRKQLHRFSMNDSYALHTSSSTGLFSDIGLEENIRVSVQPATSPRRKLPYRHGSNGQTRPVCRRDCPLGVAPRLSQSLHLPVIPKARTNPTFQRSSNRPITVPKPVANERHPQLTTHLPPMLAKASNITTTNDDADQQDWEAEEDGEDFAYETESFCSESLSSYYSESDLEQDGEDDVHREEDYEMRRAAELSQLQDYARWAKRFGGGAKGLSVASFLQEWRDSRKVGADDARTTDVRRMAERLMNGEPVLEEIVARHIPRQKTKQQERLEQIERIRHDLVAMRRRRALQQQESAIRLEQQKSSVFCGLGQKMTIPHGDDFESVNEMLPAGSGEI